MHEALYQVTNDSLLCGSADDGVRLLCVLHAEMQWPGRVPVSTSAMNACLRKACRSKNCVWLLHAVTGGSRVAIAACWLIQGSVGSLVHSRLSGAGIMRCTAHHGQG